MRLAIFHTNDLHGRLTLAKAERIRGLRSEQSESLLLDSGDCIRAGNLALPLGSDPAWDLLSLARCDAGTLGNRETHVRPKAFKAKIAGAKHPLVCANLRDKAGARPLPASLVVERGGLRVGVVGVMVPMVTERMVSRAASAFLWTPPIPEASEEAERLRPEVDLLVALTHIGFKQDLELAAACSLFDLILGGHSHTVLEQPARVGSVWVCQGGAYAARVGRYVWEAGAGLVDAGLLPL